MSITFRQKMTDEAVFGFPIRKLGALAVDAQAVRGQVVDGHDNSWQLNSIKRPRRASVAILTQELIGIAILKLMTCRSIQE
ncbi:hypothetical protein ACHAC9_09865 [Massilia sp. CMS3.1]|uniref:hypothetical protein n=1 Tax=Massilia sp. CMS3.1 TaxID=3373083 RepID=UPI003EE4D2BE